MSSIRTVVSEVFDYRDYKVYARACLSSRGASGERGPRSRFAEAVGCQTAYVSRILDGEAHLSLEQAEKANQFFGHSDEQSEFFYLLLQKARAGSPGLRAFFQSKIDAMAEERLNLGRRFAIKNAISEADLSVYFGRWQNAAAHVALLIPELAADRAALAARLGLSQGQLSEAVDLLVALGLFKKKGGRLEPTARRMHLSKDAPAIVRHHVNWRLRAVDAVERDPRKGLHYSSVIALSRDDLVRAREIATSSIEKIKRLVRDSKEETLASFCADLYEI